MSGCDVLADVSRTARISSVHVWDNFRRRIANRDGLGAAGNVMVPFSPPLPTVGGLGLSVLVDFGTDDQSEVIFRGVNAGFSPTDPPAAPLSASFSGTATIRTTNAQAPGPFIASITASVTFSSDRTSVTLSNLRDADGRPLSFPAGGISVSISLPQPAAGSFDPQTSTLTLSPTLVFGEGIGGTDRITVPLTTGSETSSLGTLTGSPVDAAGNVTVVGAATFTGGFLNGSSADFRVVGRISPAPSEGGTIMGSVYAIHGNAISVGERPGGGGAPFTGGGDLLQVSSIGWTDVVGLRQGWGTTFRGQSGKFVWFHYPFPTPVIVNDREQDMSRLQLGFDVDPGVFVESVHLWGSSNNRWFNQDSLHSTSDLSLNFDPGTIIRGTIGISIGVSFTSEGNIVFRGATVTTR
jgi:hypothetical protein